MRYQISLNDKQVRIINEALELYSRTHMGQLEEVAQLYMGRVNVKVYLQLKESLKQLCPLATGLVNMHAYRGITEKCLPESARVSWDMHQVIRHRIAWDRHPEGGFQVDYDTPHKTSVECPLLTIVEEHQ